MKVLIVGGGGREHALAWKAAQSPDVTEVLVAPGNAGTAGEDRVRNVDVAADDIAGLLTLAFVESVSMTIIGPEAPLVAGIVDAFEFGGLRCFGPGQAAARLEGSKAFMKDFLRTHRIPTADFEVFDAVEPALSYLQQVGAPVVVKADGLAAGKGVIVAETLQEAERAVREMLTDRRFGVAGARIVIEQHLTGEEASFIAMVDGEHILPLASSQDHKARDDGDVGPNTGGMGAYSPAPVIDAATHELIMDTVMRPTVAALREAGTPYRGFLYAGLMIGDDGIPRVLEYNCRFGDPETQPIMMRLRSDLVSLCDAALNGQLDSVTCEWDPRAALGVVLAAAGYPDRYATGQPIEGLDADLPGTKVFHAGTRISDESVVTAGGRVLCVVALGETVAEAHQLAYRRCASIAWEGHYYRRDIGHRAIARETR